MKPKLVTLAMTGASGAAYTLRLFECLLAEGIHVQFLTSKPGQIVVGTETDLKLTGNPTRMRKTLADYFKVDESQISVYAKDQWSAPPASGSSVADAMVVCPCTTGSLASIAAGTSDNLIHRAADVALKERKTLIIMPREAPFSTIHLENMLRLSQAGAVILPPNPGFYHGVSSVEDLIDFVVARVLDQLGIDNSISPRWGLDED